LEDNKLTKVTSIHKTPEGVKEVISRLIDDGDVIVDIVVGYKTNSGEFITAWSCSRPEVISYIGDILKLRILNMIEESG